MVLDLSRGASLAIRYGMSPYPEYEAVELVTDRIAPVANPSLALGGIEELKGVRYINFDWYCPSLGLPTWASWCRDARRPRVVAGLNIGAGLTFVATGLSMAAIKQR
ncbi:hypothetical protein [Halomonas salifodinae]|uniref:hypothetical protein n=1 Tax=Halomonas salifodinae TaxID=438745 RepID=UPI00339F74FF